MDAYYCDNYEEITGLQRGADVAAESAVESRHAAETKVIAAPETVEPVASPVIVETA